MDAMIQTRVSEVQQQYQSIQQDMLVEKKERELELQRQLQLAELEAQRARQAYDAAQTTILDLQAAHGMVGSIGSIKNCILTTRLVHRRGIASQEPGTRIDAGRCAACTKSNHSTRE
jgi:hypothetical protein